MLTQKQIDEAERKEKPYKLYDLEGLYLLINPNGSKLWRLKYRFNKKERSFSIGSLKHCSLDKARKKTKTIKSILADGQDPMTLKKFDVFKILKRQLKRLERMGDDTAEHFRLFTDFYEAYHRNVNDVHLMINEIKNTISYLEGI